MNEGVRWLLSTDGWFDHPVVRLVVAAAAAGIVSGLAASVVLAKRRELAADIRVRTLTWVVLATVTLGPILAGRLWAMLLVAAMSLWCYREFARVTGLFRWKLVSALVVLGVISVTSAHADHWPGLRTALAALVPMAIVAFSVLQDEPKGYIQRCALGAGAFLLLGLGLGRLGSLAWDEQYRAVLCAVIFSCQAGDVAAYCCGKAFGGPHLFAHTSPKKTLGGHVGGVLLVTPLAAYLYHLCWKGGPIDTLPHLLTLGALTAVLGQLGDLVIGSVKRDVGVKDMAALLPGHGGVLDRCNSLLLAAPAVYHYALYVQGIGGSAPQRIFSAAAGGTP